MAAKWRVHIASQILSLDYPAIKFNWLIQFRLAAPMHDYKLWE